MATKSKGLNTLYTFLDLKRGSVDIIFHGGEQQ